MIDDKIDRDQGFDDFRIAAEPLDRASHRGKIDNQRHASEILQNNPRDDERNFVIRRCFCVPVCQCLDVLAADFLAIAVSQHGLEHNANTHWQARNFAHALFLQRRQGMQVSFTAVARVELFERFEFVRHLQLGHPERTRRTSNRLIRTRPLS